MHQSPEQYSSGQEFTLASTGRTHCSSFLRVLVHTAAEQ
uniref:Uncharacterized protein n=1 Tax=Anguilla anguilla TaxID=7936 RepID=A0A0E9U0H4_ANGAN